MIAPVGAKKSPVGIVVVVVVVVGIVVVVVLVVAAVTPEGTIFIHF